MVLGRSSGRAKPRASGLCRAVKAPVTPGGAPGNLRRTMSRQRGRTRFTAFRSNSCREHVHVARKRAWRDIARRRRLAQLRGTDRTHAALLETLDVFYRRSFNPTQEPLSVPAKRGVSWSRASGGRRSEVKEEGHQSRGT